MPRAGEYSSISVSFRKPVLVRHPVQTRQGPLFPILLGFRALPHGHHAVSETSQIDAPPGNDPLGHVPKQRRHSPCQYGLGQSFLIPFLQLRSTTLSHRRSTASMAGGHTQLVHQIEVAIAFPLSLPISGNGRQLMTFPAESICFIFSTRRTRVSSFFASEYHTMNSFLCVNDKLLSF
jgi:hypothetical protein